MLVRQDLWHASCCSVYQEIHHDQKRNFNDLVYTHNKHVAAYLTMR